jgi:2-haloacid dehalogenase
MQLADFDALSFDCYGTLIDWESGLSAVLVPWAASRGLDLTREQLLAEYGAVETSVQEQRPGDLYPDIVARSMRLIGERLGAEVTDEEAARLGASVPDWPAFADSPGALAALAKRYQLIILSNVDRASFAGSSRRLGADFTSVITAQDVGAYKPSPRMFEALAAEAARLGIAEGRLLHVAESLFHDHVPAQRAGLPTVRIYRRHDKPGYGATHAPAAPVTPDWVFTSMAEFAAAADG